MRAMVRSLGVLGALTLAASTAAQRPAAPPSAPRRAGTATKAPQPATPSPTVTPADAPAEVGIPGVSWVSIDAPGVGRMRAVVARPVATGPFPAVILLHGDEGFAAEYVELAKAVAGVGFVAVVPCWFTGGAADGRRSVTPIPCPDAPPKPDPGSPDAARRVDALVRAVRTLSGVQADRLALVGHASAGDAVREYLRAGGRVQAAVLDAAGNAAVATPQAPRGRASTPLLTLHGSLLGEPVQREDALSRILAFLWAVLQG